QAGAALLGGETAEMPGVYGAGDFDLAGFTVGIVERDRLVDGSALRAGDRLLGLASSGPHSNGYSLIRRILAATPDGGATEWNGRPVGEALLEPTRIYVRAVLALLECCPVGALAHITGGGLPDNVARVLTPNLDAVIHAEGWQRPALFDWLQERGGISDSEMWRTFNRGVGMVIGVRPDDETQAREVLEAHGETVVSVGRIAEGTGRVRVD
ncbi:MAG: phosphoribosylformylglycinamidine cyclo-ligase, partial [Gammaproteobacteria bacterium]